MGRLNYSSRKIEGVKAGQTLSKDLRKRITPGISCRAAARDPMLEIDLTARELTDEGFAQFIEDLIECLRFRDKEHPDGAARITELHLPSNKLTIRSLARLTEVIALSAGDLRELDLSCNDIEVMTLEEQKIWQAFLESFKGCFMLRKIDFGNNPLGPRGMEIWARVYMQSDLDFLEADAEALLGARASAVEERDDGAEDVASPSLDVGGKENDTPAAASRGKKSPNKAKVGRSTNRVTSTSASTKVPTAADLKHYACTRGLRSVPYIILSNLALTNGSATHLASILSMHRAPDQLLEFLPSGKTLSLPDTDDYGTGIFCLPNSGMGPLAQQWIEMTCDLRSNTSDIESDDENAEGPNGNGHDDASGTDAVAQRRLKKKRVTECNRLAKRVRLETLKKEGVHSADIWSAAWKMMVTSRALLLEDSDRATKVVPEDEVVKDEDQGTQPPESQAPEPFADHLTRQRFEPMTTTLTIIQAPSQLSFDEAFPALGTPTRKGPVPGHLVLAPRSAQGHHHPAPTPAHAKPSQSPTKEKVPSPTTQNPTPRASKSQAPPKQTWRFGLPVDFWRGIIADAVGAEGILDKEQQMAIIRYASDWDSVAYELTIKGAEGYQQIWKFLDTVDCFAYKVST